jgi:hypothetical protein
MLTATGIATVVCMVTAVRTSSQEERPASNNSPEIRLYLDKHEVTVGDTVRVRHFVHANDDIPAGAYGHTLARLGFYHRRLKKIVYLNEYSKKGTIRVKSVFGDSLPIGAVISPPGYDYKTRHRKGYEFECQVKKPGVYLLYADWIYPSANGKYVTQASRPALLIVKLSVDGQGNEIADPTLISGEDLEEQQELESLYDDEHESEGWERSTQK